MNPQIKSRFLKHSPLACGIWIGLAMAALSPNAALAQGFTNVYGGSWTVAENWDPNTVPGPDDMVAIIPGLGAPYTVTFPGSLVVGSSSSDSSLALWGLSFGNGPQLISYGGTIGLGTAAGNNSVEMFNATWQCNGPLVVGQGGSDNNVAIQDTGSVLETGGTTIGQNLGANFNQVWVGGTWQCNGPLVVGLGGSWNDVAISSELATQSTTVGQNVGATNNTVSIQQGTWQCNGSLVVGLGGSQNAVTLGTAGGSWALTTGSTTLGQTTNANFNEVGAFATAAGTWQCNGSLVVGKGGSFNVVHTDTNSTFNTGSTTVGQDVTASTNALVVKGQSRWTDGGTLVVGDQGLGNALHVYGSASTGDATLGRAATANYNGAKIVGTWGAGALVIGDQGSGNSLLLSAPTAGGAQLTCSSATIGRGGSASNNWAYIGPFGRWDITGSLSVGPGGKTNSLTISNSLAAPARINCDSYSQGSNATLVLAPSTLNGLSDNLVVTAGAQFGGNLALSYQGPPPNVGDSFTPIKYGSMTGKFDNVSGMSFTNGVLLHPEFKPDLNASGLVLNAKLVTPSLRQCAGNPGHWGGEQYAFHTGSTICRYGCFLTSLCMALQFEGVTSLPGAATNDPGTLNQYMTNHAGCYTADNNVMAATTVASLANVLHRNLKWKTRYANSTSPLDLYHALDTGHPVIVHVPKSSDRQNVYLTNDWGHYVLVTGRSVQADGTMNFTIADPAGAATVLLGPSGYLHFRIRGWVEDPVGDMSLTSIDAPTNIDLLVTDSAGRQTGRDAASGQIIQDIPESSYSNEEIADDDGDGSLIIGGDHVVSISQPTPGIYTATLTNLQTGPYTLLVNSFTPAGNPNPPLSISGFAVQGATSTVLIPVGTTLSISRAGNGSFRLRLATDTGASFNILTSTNLKDWTFWQQLTPTNGFAETMDVPTPPQQSRFYRAVSQ